MRRRSAGGEGGPSGRNGRRTEPTATRRTRRPGPHPGHAAHPPAVVVASSRHPSFTPVFLVDIPSKTIEAAPDRRAGPAPQSGPCPGSPGARLEQASRSRRREEHHVPPCRRITSCGAEGSKVDRLVGSIAILGHVSREQRPRWPWQTFSRSGVPGTSDQLPVFPGLGRLGGERLWWVKVGRNSLATPPRTSEY